MFLDQLLFHLYHVLRIIPLFHVDIFKTQKSTLDEIYSHFILEILSEMEITNGQAVLIMNSLNREFRSK